MRRLRQSGGRGSFGSAGYKLIFGSQAEGPPQGAFRRTETPIELTKQYDSVASDEDATDTVFAGGPPWSRLLDIIGAHGIVIAAETELIGSSSNGTDQLWAKEGTFGTVTLVRWTPLEQSPGKQVAMKRFTVHSVEMLQQVDGKQAYHRLVRDIMFEIEIMGRSKHRNVVGLEAILFPETSDDLICPALLMEAADAACPDLEAFLGLKGVMARTMTSALASGIADGLNALHLLGVVHADLKPTNVLMYRENNEWVPKIADFGLSGISVSSDAPRGGTHRWNAPECLPDAPAKLRKLLLRPARDIYAFGLIYVYLLLGGRELFSQYNGDIDAVKLNTSDVVADYAWSLVEEKSPNLADQLSRTIISSTLRLDPAKRWTGLGHVSRLLSPSDKQKSRYLGFARLLRWNFWPAAQEQDGTIGEFLPFGGTSVTSEVSIRVFD
jgi:serine/threonine protein kinase